ncbi:hypothetical protein [Butyrivibrio sp. AE3004]|uniref:hypothetical protein n=1 Tax=Butyrivibrio sp. AE3004 TaxID=1506994 RepID=UPI0004940D95|nr:hypothetical protein [Butyrivibrio sp. AE3004]
MYVLDTNALYWYVGRENLGDNSNANVDVKKFCSFLDGRTDKSLASSSYVEALVRFRNNPEYIEKIHAFMLSKDIPLLNNVQYQTFSTEQITSSLTLCGDQISQYIKEKILPVKINIEASFALSFLMTILLLYTKCRIDECGCICPSHGHDIEMFIRDKKVNIIGEELRATLKDAYDNHYDHEQQLLKEKYIELLEDACMLTDTVIELISTKGISVSSLDICDVEVSVRQKYISLRAKKPDNYLMESICDLLTSRPDFIDLAKNRLAEMYSSRGKLFKDRKSFAFKPIQIEYIAEEMYHSWIDNAQKFRKNDIFDLFFLGCADFKDDRKVDNFLIDKATYLLTFDQKLDRFIERKRPINGKVIRRFYNDF